VAEARGILRIVRALRAHEHRTAAGLLALLVFAYLWPVLGGGKALAPTSLLYVVSPWRTLAAPGVRAALNHQLEDVVDLYYPWDVLARRFIHAGTFPAWNPHALGGTPLFANFQIAWASPFSLPLWLLALNYGLGVAAAIKLWLAGFGTYLLARELRLGFWAGITAGVSFALCAFNVVWLSHGVFVSVSAMLPWGIWLAERLVRRGRPADGLALVAVAAIIQTGGHPGTQLHVTSAIVLYALVRAATAMDARAGERLRRLGLVGAALAIGTLLSAVVLLPGQEASVETIGAWVRRHEGSAFHGGSMPWHVIRTALFPDWWGRPSEMALEHGPANYRERTFYAGSIPLLLALMALVGPGAWRRKAPFAALAVLGALIAIHTPLQSLARRLPLFDSVQDQRILLWFVFAVAVLAGFGLQSVLDRPRSRRNWAVLGVALLAGVVAAVAVGAGDATPSAVLRHLLERSGDPGAQVLALASVGWWLVFVLACGALLLLIRRRSRIGAALLALVVALDMLHFAHGYQSMIPRGAVVPPVTPAIAFLQRHARDGRIAAFGWALPADFTTVYGLRDVRGADVPQPTLRFDHLWVRMNPDADVENLGRLGPEGPKAFGVLGARYFVAEPEQRVQAVGFTPVYRGADATIYRNAFALPRAEVASTVRAAADIRDEVAAVVGRSFDARSDAIVPSGQLHGGALPADGATGTVRVTDERDAQVTMRATLGRRGLVILDDAWAPGWSVRVDGRPAQALITDVVLRGVIVPAGTHTIVWSYEVPGLRAGAALSGAGVLLVLAWGGWLLTRRRRAARSRGAPAR
jgi:hypothetical protein